MAAVLAIWDCWPTGFQGFRHPALFLDFLEDRPGFTGDRVGEIFDVPGTASRVHGAGDVAFLAQHGVHVAGDAAGEFIRHTDQFIERRNVQAVATADGAGKRLGGGAQQVDVRVVDSLVPGRGAGV